MSLLMVSCKRSTLYAPMVGSKPGDRGKFIDEKFDPATLVGEMETLVERDALPDVPGDSGPLARFIDARVSTLARSLPDDQPVVVMVHGFLFDPTSTPTLDPVKSDNAHARLYHYQDNDVAREVRHHTTGWPLWLGFEGEDRSGRSGLAVGLSWHSAPGIAQSLLEAGKNFYSRAYTYATETAWCLACVLMRLAQHPRLAGREIDVFAHSLGTRVVLRAIALLAKHEANASLSSGRRALAGQAWRRLGRVIMLGGAEYIFEAQVVYKRLHELGFDASEQGFGPQFYNVGCVENDVLDLLGENFGPRGFGNHDVIGHNGLGSAVPAPRWLDLQIDSNPLREWFKELDDLDICGDQPWNVWDHWYYFTHRGNMELYRKILRERERYSINSLRAILADGLPLPEGIGELGED
jgi:hypothetical protein